MKHIYYLLILFALFSCGTGLQTSKSQTSTITKDFKASFKNIPAHSSRRAHLNKTALQLFNVNDVTADSFSVSFTRDGKLAVSTQDSIRRTYNTYTGEFRNGYYEIYFAKKNIQIPPLLPFIYGVRNIDRVRIGLTSTGELIVDHKYVRDGMLLFFAAGHGNRSQYYFSKQ